MILHFPPRPFRPVVCLLALLASILPVAAATFTVTNVNDAGAGSLRQAVLDANASGGSDTIAFAAALNGLTITLASQINVAAASSTTTIDASALAQGITVSGNDVARIFALDSTTQLALNRLRLVHGTGANGGAIANSGGQLVLTDCTFTDNVATNFGGAIWSGTGSNCSINAQNCTFDRNTALDSGALYLTGAGNSFLSACTFTGNRGTNSNATGAITLTNTVMTVNHCTVFANAGGFSGGGIFVSGTIALNRCLFAGNTSTDGSSPDFYSFSATIQTNGNPSLLGSNGGSGNGNVSATFPTGALVGTTGALLDPKLRPLGPGGGITWTLAPLFGSPAIDAGGVSPFTTDQRGFPRNVGSACDLGAVERGPILTVTNINDAGAGSLRDTLAAVTQPDTRVQFASTLTAETITLTSGTLFVGAGTVDVDASTLAGGITISGGGASLVVFLQNCNVALNQVTLTNGSSPMGGGALYAQNGGFLLAVDCTFSNSRAAGQGGGLEMIAGCAAALHRCTISGNSTASGGSFFLGGGIYVQNAGRFLLSNCTVSGNAGGGVSAQDAGCELELIHSTITGNSQNAGVTTGNIATARIERCLIAGNTGLPSPDITRFSGVITPVGANLIGNNGGTGSSNVADVFPASTVVGTPAAPVNALLNPLFRTGGFTATHSPQFGSPALDNAGASLLASDQRGFPRGVGTASDLGAVERGPFVTVANANDAGTGSLRAAVAAATAPDAAVLFATGLNGQSISLTSGALIIAANQSVQIEASNLSSGVRLLANGSSRVFQTAAGSFLTLSRIGVSGGVSSGQGGGINSSGTISLYQCDLFGNQAADGGALFATAGRAELVGCRVASNAATAGAAALGRSGSAAVTATDCWFGSNNPTAPSFFTTGVTFTPFVTFSESASPGTIQVGGSSTLTASVATNSGGQTVSLDRLFPLIGRAIGFSGAVNGTLSNAQTTIQANGTAIATFTGTAAGSGSANASFDGVTASTNIAVTAAPTPTPSPTPSPTPVPTRLGNVSTRLRVETGDNVLIGGFIVTGTQPKRVILRAIGPSLPLANKLANPTLELVGPGGTIATNDNWRSTQEAEIIASLVPPTSDLESAIVATLPANSTGYTAIVRGVSNGTGAALVEVYDLDAAANSSLANISTRGFVQTGDDVMIGGFIVTGSGSRKVIVRAIGPSLPVAGKLADPILELYNGNGVLIGSNDNWRTGGQEAEIIASLVPPTSDLESAIVATLPNTGHTAIVRGKNGTTGVALVEVYSLE